MEEWKVGTKRKSPKQGLTCAEVLTIMHPGDASLPTIGYTKLTNLT